MAGSYILVRMSRYVTGAADKTYPTGIPMAISTRVHRLHVHGADHRTERGNEAAAGDVSGMIPAV